MFSVVAGVDTASKFMWGDFSNIWWSSLITGSTIVKEMKYASHHHCDKTRVGKMA